MARELDVGMKCIKYMLFISNFMFVMIGFLLISIGSTVNTIYYDFEIFMESHHFKPAELLIAIGIIIFLVALFGCIGAIRESTLLINIYAIFLLLILILEISAAIAAYAMRNNIYEYTRNNMQGTIQEYETDVGCQESWDFMQQRLYCCGIEEPNDWESVSFTNGTLVTYKNKAIKVPNSCVRRETEELYHRGCLRQLNSIISSSALMIGIGCTCVAFVQLMGVIFASALAKTIRGVKTAEEVRKQENRMRIYEELQLQRGQQEKIVPVLYGSSDA